MAQIIYLHHEDISRALIESALQTREIGFTGASGYEELILKAESGSYYHFASLERLDDHVASGTSGAKLIGFAPPAGMSSTDVQSAIEELKTSVGSGSVVGSGTAGKIVLWVSGTTLGNSSILAEASSKLNFSGDTVANFYRSAASTMKTDAAFQVVGLLTALGALVVTNDINVGLGSYFGSSGLLFDNSYSNGARMHAFEGSVTKNNSNTRQFYGLRIYPILNTGGSNSNTTFDVFSIDTINTGITGLTTNLLHLFYGGSERVLIDSFGSIYSTIGDVTAGRDLISNRGIFGKTLSVGLTPVSNVVTAPTSGFRENAIVAIFQRNLTTTIEHSLFGLIGYLDAGGSNLNETLNLFSVDTISLSGSTGMAINLMKLAFNGTEIVKLTSAGYMIFSSGSPQIKKNNDSDKLYLCGGSDVSSANGAFIQLNGNSATINGSARIFCGNVAGALIDLVGDTTVSGFLKLYKRTVTPADPVNANEVNTYMKGTLLVYQYYDAGTVRYKYIDLSGTGVTFTHSTTAP